jgi:SAM-dependent methyltransferase
MISERDKLREFAARYTAAWCSRDPAGVAAFYSPGGLLVVDDGAPAHGRPAISEAVQSFMTTFRDSRMVMDDVLVRSESAEFHWTLMGAGAVAGGTGNGVRISGFEVWRFGKDGLIAESRLHVDRSAHERRSERGVEGRTGTSAHRFVRHLVSGLSSRPSLTGSETILGSFPPFEHHFVTGRQENYCIHDGYRSRQAAASFDDSANDDHWQLEVYKFAREVSDKYGLQTICDVGCGSGYKLVTHFADFVTIGIDLPATCNFLRAKWPDRCWIDADPEVVPSQQIDLVIASDVIEHVPDPDELVRYIKRLSPRYAVISTPDRNLLRVGTHDGPPANPAHVREWSFAEFHAYIAQSFRIEEHFISCAAQGTQCLLCTPVDDANRSRESRARDDSR